MRPPPGQKSLKATRTRVFGWTLVAIGVLVIIFREQIVFPGLELLVGIETIVGEQNVVYEPNGGYCFTNPSAMMLWISSVGAVGVLICLSGVGLLFRAHRPRTMAL
jgi:hypothetical protein